MGNSNGREEKIKKQPRCWQAASSSSNEWFAVQITRMTAVMVNVCMYWSVVAQSVPNDKSEEAKSTVGGWVRREDWIDDRYVQPWRMQAKRKGSLFGVVGCLDLSCPGYAVLCCACSVGRSAWAIWFQFGPVQI